MLRRGRSIAQCHSTFVWLRYSGTQCIRMRGAFCLPLSRCRCKCKVNTTPHRCIVNSNARMAPETAPTQTHTGWRHRAVQQIERGAGQCRCVRLFGGGGDGGRERLCACDADKLIFDVKLCMCRRRQNKTTNPKKEHPKHATHIRKYRARLMHAHCYATQKSKRRARLSFVRSFACSRSPTHKSRIK